MNNYRVINEKYGAEATEATIDELRALLTGVFGDYETELVEREDGIYEAASGEIVAERTAKA